MTRANAQSLIKRVLLASPFRLFAVYVSLFCAAVAITFIYVYLAMQGFLAQEAETAVQADVEVLQAQYREGGPSALLNAVSERSAPSGNALYLLTDGTGHRLAGNIETVAAHLWNTQGPVDFAYRTRSGGKVAERQAFGFVERFPGDLRLVVGRDVEAQETVKRVMRYAFLLGYGFIALIGFAGGAIVSRRLLRRVDAASNAARAIMDGNLAERLPVTGRRDEFDRLSQSLNAMLDRIQDLMTGLKDVSDNIAHDLKTPLHRLRTRAERALQSSPTPEKLAEALGTVIEEADTLIQTFDALLSIARLEAGSRAESFGPLNICALVRDVADLYEPASEEQQLRLRLACVGDIMIAGEKHLLGQAMANLLDNAIKYASPASGDSANSEVEAAFVDIGLEDKGDAVDIIVADHGPGIPAKDRERVLQRFVRLQPSRSIPGTGLGLSLVAAVARLHGGSVSLEDNRPGLRIRLRIQKNLPQTPKAGTPEARALLHHAS